MLDLTQSVSAFVSGSSTGSWAGVTGASGAGSSFEDLLNNRMAPTLATAPRS